MERVHEECCIPRNTFKHSKKEIWAALGLDKKEADEVKRLINEFLEEEKVISRIIEKIWGDGECRLTLQARIYATFMLGVEVYDMILVNVMKSIELSSEELGSEGEAGQAA